MPQVIKTLRSGDTAAISLRMYLLFTSGIALWGIYGLLKGDGLLIVANAIPLVSAGLILHCKRWALLAGRRCRSAELGQPLALAVCSGEGSRHNAIAPQVFGGIQQVVGSLQQPIELQGGARVGLPAGQAEADGEAPAVHWHSVVNARIRHGLAQALSDRRRGLMVGAGQDHAEFLASEPGHHGVALRQLFTQHRMNARGLPLVAAATASARMHESKQRRFGHSVRGSSGASRLSRSHSKA